MKQENPSLSECITHYCQAVADGELPRAYRGIVSALLQFKSAWELAHPAQSAGALYAGYLDMSFVAVAPEQLAAKRLKVSLVFLHASGTFSLWLTAGNRGIQKRISESLARVPLQGYSLTKLEPGVDAIIAYDLEQPYAFDEPARLTSRLLTAVEAFAADMITLTESIAP